MAAGRVRGRAAINHGRRDIGAKCNGCAESMIIGRMMLTFRGPIWHWRGPAPYFFVTVPDAESRAIKSIAGLATYGWGMIPAFVQVGKTTWKTSLWRRDGHYVVPLKDAVRAAEGLNEGDDIDVQLEIRLRS